MSKFTASLKKLIMELYEGYAYLLQDDARVSVEARVRFRTISVGFCRTGVGFGLVVLGRVATRLLRAQVHRLGG